MMFEKVMEGERGQAWIGCSGTFVRRVALPLVLLCAVTGTNVWAQADGAASTFRATVMDLSKDSQTVSVALNRSVIIKTNIKVSRVDVVAGQIAEVRLVSPTELLLTGLSYGRTNVILWDATDHQYLLNVGVELDIEELDKALAAIDPQSNASAKSILGNIVLTGTVSSLERAKRMVELATLFLPPSGGAGKHKTAVQNHLDVAGEQQVLLRCVVAEMSRTALRELGVNGFLAGENFRDGFLINQIGGINPINIGAAAGALVTENIPFLTGEDGIPVGRNTTLSLGLPRGQAQFFIKTMADNKLASILAEPNLVAISGETASFLAGGEFPIPVPQGNQQVTIEFREFGVRLNFTPVVLGHQRIRLRVAPEVSELDFTTAIQIEGFVVPGLTTRATETTIEVGSGQTIAIAGLLSEQVRGIASRVPGIGDIPILGALFRSVNFQRSVTELIILVTPEIISPLEPHQPTSLPTDNRLDPDDFELYMLGLLEGLTSAEEIGSDDEHLAGTPGTTALVRSDPAELSVHGPWGLAGVPKTR